MSDRPGWFSRAFQPGYWFGNTPNWENNNTVNGNPNIVGTEGYNNSQVGDENDLLSRAVNNGKFGFRNIGSAQYGEDPWLLDDDGEYVLGDDGQPKPNPMFGLQTNKGLGLFGKEGGFMSKFGTGQGAMSNFMENIGSGLQDAAANMGQGHQYGPINSFRAGNYDYYK